MPQKFKPPSKGRAQASPPGAARRCKVKDAMIEG
jgi:hypothetical protein